jgi:tRNA (adenine57-N1/adenine58-N1)-methyltransferase catalytic subunit
MTRPRRGPFSAGEQVQLTDQKGRQHLVVLASGKVFHTHRGALAHDDLIGAPEGSVVRSSGGTPYVALRPLLADYTLAMKRGAAVVYPKDAAQILGFADLYPGVRVLEAGAGSGALTCWLLRAAGDDGVVVTYERRADFAEIARGNVERFFGGPHPAWRLIIGDLAAPAQAAAAGAEPAVAAAGGAPGVPDAAPGPPGLAAGAFDRVVLDMLAPWECLAVASCALIPGGVICCYVATTTQLAKTVEALRAEGSFDEPAAWETLARGWHADGLAVRPEHRMVGHTGFLITARRLADGVVPPVRRRRT